MHNGASLMAAHIATASTETPGPTSRSEIGSVLHLDPFTIPPEAPVTYGMSPLASTQSGTEATSSIEEARSSVISIDDLRESAKQKRIFRLDKVQKPSSLFRTTAAWRGEVLQVDNASFVARLRPGGASEVEEIATFDIDEVEPGNSRFVKPGAIFRWHVGDFTTDKRQVIKGSVLVFRRMPAWSKRREQAAEEEAEEQLSCSDGDMLEKKPEQNEIEVSVFGRGFGECVLVHLCNNDWLCIDSCRDSSSGRPVALQYLDRLGLDPAAVVRMVFATHWDDDHIVGLAEAYAACKAAQFVISAGLETREFLKLVHGIARSNVELGVDEFDQIIQEMKARKKASRSSAFSPMHFVTQDTVLFREGFEMAGEQCTREVATMSPSPAAILRSFGRIAALFPRNLQPLGRPPHLESNHTSVVLWVRVGNRALLLGADLEEVADRTDGWSGIVAFGGRPMERASMFKIPHHGSRNGHHDQVWDDLLTDAPVAALTPFHYGRVRLPTKDDVERICLRTRQAYCAGSVTTPGSEAPNRQCRSHPSPPGKDGRPRR